MNANLHYIDLADVLSELRFILDLLKNVALAVDNFFCISWASHAHEAA